ncbi:MAG: DnaD domain protein [Tenericutes bacterium]|nr:DnaD domain protein [Mycoplasmatota bacterium]
MKSSKLVEILKKGNFVVPFYLFQLKDKFNISFDSFIFLIYLSNLGTNIIFDPNRFTTDLGLSMELILSYIDELSEKKYISIDVIKNDKGVMEEYVILDLFYEKVTNLMIDDINQAKIEEEKNSNIYEAIEKEFARPLTSIEYEIISAWLEDGTSEELILEALKEAVYSGVCNLRYIDKILYEWGKKGIKTAKDVEKNRINFKEKQEKKEKLELFDYDWFDDEERED